MTDQAQQPITPEELQRRKASIQDAYEFSAYIPDELRTRLETLLEGDARQAVLELQILAIKFGRAIQRRDSEASIPFAVAPAGKRPSDLVTKLVNSLGQPVHKVNEEKKVDILVAPGFLDVTKKDPIH